MTDTPKIGDNSRFAEPDELNLVSLDPDVIRGDLMMRFAPELKQDRDLMAGFARFEERVKALGIDSDEDAAKAGAFAKQIKDHSKKLNEIRLKEKKVFDAAGSVVHGFFKARTDELDKANGAIIRQQTAYLTAKEAREREERKKEADRLRVEAEKKAREAEASRDPEELAAAIAQVDNAEKMEKKAAAPAASMSRVRSEHGTTTSLASVKKYRVINVYDVPRDLLMVNPDAVKAAIKDFKEGEAQPIPGIEVYFEKTARNR